MSPEAAVVAPLSDLERASGSVLLDTGLPPLPVDRGAPPPRTAFESVVREALLAPPCVVSFSGGRDSSAVLAVAADLARREGHAPPVAVTLRFPDVPLSEESDWQHAVVEHLGVADWVQVELHDELDLLGELAQGVLRRHGVLWPCNTHAHDPVARLARGGTVLTGIGGDEIMEPAWNWLRVNRLLGGQVSPRPADLLRLAAAYGPAPLRRAGVRRGRLDDWTWEWLTAGAEREVRRAVVERDVDEPVRFDRQVRESWWPSRYRQLVADGQARLAADHGAVAVHPFLDPRFLSAVATRSGRTPPRSRTEAVHELVGDLLPRATITRVSMASFDGAFWGPRTRRFVRDWRGEGLDPALVRVDVLVAALRAGVEHGSDTRMFTAMQSAWLAQQG